MTRIFAVKNDFLFFFSLKVSLRDRATLENEDGFWSITFQLLVKALYFPSLHCYIVRECFLYGLLSQSSVMGVIF